MNSIFHHPAGLVSCVRSSLNNSLTRFVIPARSAGMTAELCDEFMPLWRSEWLLPLSIHLKPDPKTSQHHKIFFEELPLPSVLLRVSLFGAMIP
jgi:hypothetical protein